MAGKELSPSYSRPTRRGSGEVEESTFEGRGRAPDTPPTGAQAQ